MSGIVCGFLFGLATLHRYLEQIVDAVYQTIRGMLIDSLGKLGDGRQSIPTERIGRLLDSDAGIWVTSVAKNFGPAKKLYEWIVRKPVQLVRASIVGEFLPSIKVPTVSLDTLDEFVKNHLVQVVRVPLQAQLRMVQYAAVGIGLAALVLPLILIRFT